MRYSVTWTHGNGTTGKFVDAVLEPITDATHRIELEPRNDAEKKGIDWRPFRAYSDDPLAVLFSVNPDDCRVWIAQVRETI